TWSAECRDAGWLHIRTGEDHERNRRLVPPEESSSGRANTHAAGSRHSRAIPPDGRRSRGPLTRTLRPEPTRPSLADESASSSFLPAHCPDSVFPPFLYRHGGLISLSDPAQTPCPEEAASRWAPAALRPASLHPERSRPGGIRIP